MCHEMQTMLQTAVCSVVLGVSMLTTIATRLSKKRDGMMLYALHVNACCLTRDAAAKNIQTNEQTNRQTNVTSATILPLGYAACKPRSKTSALRLLALPSFAMKREIEPGTFRKEMIANGNRPSFKAAFACTSVATRSQGQSRSNKPARCNASETLSSFGKYCGKCFQQDAKCGFIL